MIHVCLVLISLQLNIKQIRPDYTLWNCGVVFIFYIFIILAYLVPGDSADDFCHHNYYTLANKSSEIFQIWCSNIYALGSYSCVWNFENWYNFQYMIRLQVRLGSGVFKYGVIVFLSPYYFIFGSVNDKSHYQRYQDSHSSK